jgi:equilibrative nucleoside transporter 1/2/3
VTANGTDVLTPRQIQFQSDLSVASAVPNTVFLILNALLSQKFPLKVRMIGSLVVMLVIFIVTTIFVKVDTDSWQDEFFIITLSLVVVINGRSNSNCSLKFVY